MDRTILLFHILYDVGDLRNVNKNDTLVTIYDTNKIFHCILN